MPFAFIASVAFFGGLHVLARASRWLFSWSCVLSRLTELGFWVRLAERHPSPLLVGELALSTVCPCLLLVADRLMRAGLPRLLLVAVGHGPGFCPVRHEGFAFVEKWQGQPRSVWGLVRVGGFLLQEAQQRQKKIQLGMLTQQSLVAIFSLRIVFLEGGIMANFLQGILGV